MRLNLAIFGALIFFLSGCATTGVLETQSLQGLEKHDWQSGHRETIDQLIAARGRGDRPAEGPAPLVTLDWDNTMILNDIGEATFMHLADEMAFSYNAEFWKLIPRGLRSNLKKAYLAASVLEPGDRRGNRDYETYRKLLVKSYWDLCDRKGSRVCYAWAAQIMTGLSVERIREAANAALDRELNSPVGSETLSTGKNDASPLKVHRGIRYYPQMVRLVRRLREHGFDVWIVSASTQWIVEEAASRIGVPASRVIGMLPALDSHELVTPMMLRTTYRDGKAKAIRNIIKRTPVFAAGDSTTDLEMLELGDGPRLVIDRGKKELLEAARKYGWMIQRKFLEPVQK